MKHAIQRQMIITGLIGSIALTGCTNTKEDQVTMQGTAGGAAVGALVGALIGDDASGALIGAAIGGGIGYLVAQDVAKRQAQYASREQLIAGETRHAETVLRETRETNAGLRRDVASLGRDVSRLQARARAGRATNAELRTQKGRVVAKRQAAEKALEAVDREYQVAARMLKSERTRLVSGSAELAAWQSKIEALEAEKQKLENIVGELVAMDDSMVL